MTCEELAEQVATLTANLTAIDLSISTKTSDANLQFATVVAGDTYGGTFPQLPLTASAVGMRVTYLNSLNPRPPQTLIDGYIAIWNILTYIENSLQPARAQTVSQLGSMKQAQIDQGC